MISLGTLADALAPPLIEEPLKLDKTEVVERGAEQGPPPEPAEIPIVSIGRPRAWLTDNIPPSPGDGWAATSPAIHEDERVLLLRMACSFRPRSDRVKIVWADLPPVSSATTSGCAPPLPSTFTRTASKSNAR